MWAVPDPERWKRALRGSHTATIRMELWADGTILSEAAPFEGGSVTDEWVTGARRSLSTSIFLNRSWRRWLDNYSGLELRPYRGVRFSRHSLVECPMGRFPMRQPDIGRNTEAISVQCDDYFQRATASKFGGPTMSPGGRITLAIAQLLTQAGLPDARITATSTRSAAPVLLDGNERDQAVADLARSIAAEVYLDREGVPRIANARTIGAPTVDLGRLGYLIKLDISKVYNVVSVRSSASDVDFGTVTAAITWPEHPAHPYRLGSKKYPEYRVLNYASPLLLDAAQGIDAARTILARRAGQARTVQYSDIPDPSTDAGDTATGTTKDGREVAQIQTVVTPLTVQEMQVITTVSTQIEED